MALLKDIDSDFSSTVVASYHLIRQIMVHGEDRLEVYLDGYVSKQDFLDGKKPVVTHHYNERVPEFDKSASAWGQAYAWLKAKPEFEGAVYG